jgi:hypothetical protein
MDNIKNAGRNLAKVATHPEKYWDEFVSGLIPEEGEDFDAGVKTLSLVNNFER